MNNKKYYIYIHNISFEVSKEDYKRYYKELEHSKYLRKEEKKVTVISYEEMGENLSCEGFIADDSVNVEETAIHNILLDKLKMALKTLSSDEIMLINALIYQKQSEHELSKMTGIPQKTINNRKQQILRKLKKILEN